MGSKLVDNAYKTIAAIGHVYVEPVADTSDMGKNFRAVRVTTVQNGIGPDRPFEDNTGYAALDAALRLTWDMGGAVDASHPGCVAVIDAYGYVAPLAMAPVVRDGDSVVPLEVRPEVVTMRWELAERRGSAW
ncbi:hypothetical protein Sste5344_004486 [Sporothrix stenoceras]